MLGTMAAHCQHALSNALCAFASRMALSSASDAAGGRFARGGGMTRSQVTSREDGLMGRMGSGDAIGQGQLATSLALPFLPFCPPARPVPAKAKLSRWRANHEVSGCLDLCCTLAPVHS